MRIEDRGLAATAQPLEDALSPDAPGTAEVPGGPAAGPELLPPLLRSAAVTLLTLYFLLLGWLALRQVPTHWSYDANLTPFASVHRALTTGGAAGLRQVASSLAVLAPLGVLLPLARGRLRHAWLPSFLHTLGTTALIATALEVIRTGLTGYQLNVDDIVLGTIGAAVAHLVVVPVGRGRLRARLARHPWPERPVAAAAADRPELGDAPVTSSLTPFQSPRAESAVPWAGHPGDTGDGRAQRLRSHRPGTLPASVIHRAPVRAHHL
ncbi:VanZ family protein [Kitasatospora kifunensis]|uniref:Glycopeptide antibiotics resistance protein n=1 Tax=Kitasatospora kifunensis TaxID=58351 RepID=A0A7W7VX77_KITKI|nr:VanZ family protein [Kitasatospora kifunensis]MBB4925335.1 glycopeptide antibiotics resistance protein [Kitasatospora kifunensis]